MCKNSKNSKLLIAFVLALLTAGCTAALVSMQQCNKTCTGGGGGVSLFEMRGDPDNLVCRCHTHTSRGATHG